MPRLCLTVIDETSPRIRLKRDRLQALLERVLREARIARASLTVLLVDEAASARLHHQHFGDPAATDVMSFPDGTSRPRQGGVHLGDLAVCVAVARREAAGHGMGLPEELTLYILHGLLHLVGYDDRNPRELKRMWAAQRRLLAHVGIALARTPE
jgi:probable rRNA maturation factor